MQIKPALDGLVDRLRAAGLNADVDPALVNVTPAGGLWVQPREVLDHRQTLRVWVYLIVPNAAFGRALELLDDALERVLAVVDPIPDEDAFDLSTALVLPSGPNPLPAYRVATDLDL